MKPAAIRTHGELAAALSANNPSTTGNAVKPPACGGQHLEPFRCSFRPDAGIWEIRDLTEQYCRAFDFLVNVMAAPATEFRMAQRWCDAKAITAELRKWHELKNPRNDGYIDIECFLICALDHGCRLRKSGGLIEVLLPRRELRLLRDSHERTLAEQAPAPRCQKRTA